MRRRELAHLYLWRQIPSTRSKNSTKSKRSYTPPAIPSFAAKSPKWHSYSRRPPGTLRLQALRRQLLLRLRRRLQHPFWRVQVKSTHQPHGYGYSLTVQHFKSQGSPHYTPEEIDMLVGYVVPADAWYILPLDAFLPRRQLSVPPRLTGAPFLARSLR
jgi:hypothetical protein